MNKWIAAAPVLVLFGFGAWMAAADNGRLARQIASAEVDSVLDAISWTDEQRVVLEGIREAVSARVHSSLAQLPAVFWGKHACPTQRLRPVASPKPVIVVAWRSRQWSTAIMPQLPKAVIHNLSMRREPDARCWRTLR